MDQNKKKQWLVLIMCAAAVILLCVLFSGISENAEKDDSHSFSVYMTEILSSNSIYTDSLGHTHDFLELYNSADAPIDISGFKLTDDQKSIGYVIPEGTILGPGEYLVIWCEKDNDEGIADFSISKEGGEVIYLMNRKNVIIDTVSTLPCKSNMSMVLSGSTWTLAGYATPGFPNTQTGHEAYLRSRSASGFSLCISEVISSNTLFAAEDGTCSDMVELHNTSDKDLDISGCRLSDDPEKIKYSFPDGTVLGPGAYLVLWCGSGTEAGFGISSAGETLILQSPGGDIIQELEIPSLEKNTAWVLTEDGTYLATSQVTPGYSNDAAGYEAYMASLDSGTITVSINEVMSSNATTRTEAEEFCDWVELYNASQEETDLTGWWISDDPSRPFKWMLPSCTISPGGYLLIYCDGKNTSEDGLLHASFSLDSFGETLILSTPAGAIADSLSLPQMTSDSSCVKDPEGNISISHMPTPGLPNTREAYISYQETLSMPEGLCLNEVMTRNDQYLQQRDNKYYDWVELYNNSSADVDLSSFYLTDSLSDPTRCSLPQETLAPGKYTVIVLKDDLLSLNSQEEWLYLCSANGKVLDCMHLVDIPYRYSYGRSLSGNGFFYFPEPTPGEENSSGEHTLSDSPEASADPGIYDDITGLTVSLTAPEGSEIYYTTDGSWPSFASAKYEAPLDLTATTIIRAFSVSPGSVPSNTVTLPYIINEGHTLPVVSLTLDRADLYGSSGIITIPESESEKYGNITFLDTDGSSFTMDCGVSLYGSLSRFTNYKKSFKLRFRSLYGDSRLHYDLYDDCDVESFSSLVLRNSQDYPLSFFREELMTTLVQDCSEELMTAHTRYCILYLNGQYYGIFALKEAFSEAFYAEHKDYPEETCRCVRVIDVLEEGPDLYEIMRYANRNDLSDPDAYAYVSSQVDVDSAIDWIIFEAYCANSDILNNVRYMQSTQDNIWHYVFYDLDWSMYTHYTMAPLDPEEQFSMIPRGLLQNPEFRDRFLKRLAYLLGTTLSDENVLARIDELTRELEPEMPRERQTWEGSMDGWYYRIGELKDFAHGRAEEVIWDFADYLGLSSQDVQSYFGDLL
ncbi:MAG: lamin tail domain-containing protein [Lachnospiraceae bacterium]|nr:lamin tail domain-containing protein [Lachnospiraceae bacterium]